MKKYLLFIISMLCAVTGAWATPTITGSNGEYTINTDGDEDLSDITWSGLNGDPSSSATSITVTGALNSKGLEAILSKFNPYGNSGYGNMKFDLSGATATSLVFPSSFTGSNYIGWLLLPVGQDYTTVNYAVLSELKHVYACKDGVITYVNVNESNKTAQQIIDGTPSAYSGKKTYNIQGLNAESLRTALAAIEEYTVVIPYDGNATAAAGSVRSDVTAQLTAKSAVATDVKTLSLTAGTLSADDIDYIKTLTNLTTLNLANATVTAEQIFQLLSETSIASIVLSDAQKSSLRTLFGKTFTGDMLARVGMTSSQLLDGMTNKNYIIQGTTLFVTGLLESSDADAIKQLLTANPSIRMFDVTRCTNNSENVTITDANFLTDNVTSVSLPGNEYITYSGTKTKLENGALTIAIGTTYTTVGDALNDSNLQGILNSGNVKHVKVTGTLTTTDFGNIHNIGLTYTGKVETIDLSTVTTASDANWGSLAGDFGKAGVMLPTNKTTGTMTNANVFTADFSADNKVLNATLDNNASTEFNKELQYFAQLTRRYIIKTAASVTNDMLSLDGVLAVVHNDGLGALIRPNHETTSGELTALTSAFPSLKYIYSPTSDNQTLSEQFVPDRILVLVPGGLDAAIKTETGVQNAIYVKIKSASSSVVLNNEDLNLKNTDGTSEVKATADGQHGWQFCDFSEAALNPATVTDVAAAHSYPYRIILPNNIPNDQMAGFSANPNAGSLAAVYTYFGNTLHILEVKDNAYSTSALSDPRIVRPTTDAIELVAGAYNGTKYTNFGDNLRQAINNAQATIKTLTVSTGMIDFWDLYLTNTNLETINLYTLNASGRNVTLSGCTSLKTLTATNTTVSNLTAKAPALETVNLSGTIVEGTADFTNAPITTFTTNVSTWFKNDLKLINTKLTSFATDARMGMANDSNGNIYLNGTSTLGGINLLSTQFQNTNSKIHIDASTTEVDGNTDIIPALKQTTGDPAVVVKTIKVPTGFAADTRIHPYTTTYPEFVDQRISAEEAVAPEYVYAKSYMELHEFETGDKYVYWHGPTSITDSNYKDETGILTIGMTHDRSLDTILKGVTDVTDKRYNRVTITGHITNEDMAAISSINADILDLSNATLEKKEGDNPSFTYTIDNSILKSATNSNVKFVVLPKAITRGELELSFNTSTKKVESALLAGFTGLYSAVAFNADTKTMVTYVKEEGTLQPGVVAANGPIYAAYGQPLATFGDNFKPTSLPTGHYAYYPVANNVDNLYLSGNLKAYDVVSNGQLLDAEGNLHWNKEHAESVTPDPTRKIDGTIATYGGLNGASIKMLDMKYASFPKNTDMTVSIWNSVGSQCIKCVIPEMPTVTTLPADFFNINGSPIWAWCIPSNIEKLCSRAFITADYIWTTSNSTVSEDPEGANTRLDNGIFRTEADFDSNTKSYATTDKRNTIDPNFVYHVTETNPRPYMGSYTFGSNIKVIETGFLPDTQPNVGDVYVLNTEAPKCHVDAFNTTSYFAHGGFDPTISDGIIKRKNYKGMAILHYPRQTVTPNVQRYTDPTRQYSVATGMRDGKGATLYFPTHSEFIRSYTQGTTGYTWNAWDPTREYGMVKSVTSTTDSKWTAEFQTQANNLYNSNTTVAEDTKKWCSFYDVTGGDNTKPTSLVDYDKVYWSDTEYKNSDTAGGTYQQLYDADYRGWHQFVLTAYAANTVLEEEPFRSYITDSDWWTYCPTIDMTYNDVMLIFGDPNDATKIPFVSKLRYVIRDYGNQKILLNFTENLMTNKEDRAKGTDMHGQINSLNGVVQILSGTQPAATDKVMAAGVPYLIKPTFVGGSPRMFRVFSSTEEMKKTTSLPTVRDVADADLYAKIKASQELSGTQQMDLVNNGIYTVPVFVTKDIDDSDWDKEDVVTKESVKKEYEIGNTKYYMSAQWTYSFVGTFYKSFMPHYSIFLGWDSSKNCASFYYHDGNFSYHDNYMNWNNETGVICPLDYKQLTGKAKTDFETNHRFPYTVSVATSKDSPAQWKLTEPNASGGTHLLHADIFTKGSSAPLMIFDAADVKAIDNGDATGIKDVNGNVNDNTTGSVYTLDGRKVGNSLEGLSQGIYIVNGKKYVVK